MAVKKHGVNFDITAQNGASVVFQTLMKDLQGVRKGTDSLVEGFRTLFAITAGAAFTRELVQAGLEGEKSANRLTAVLKATGNQVGLTRRELDEMADSLSEATQFDDDGIRNAQAELIKFGNIHGEVFAGALKASADLAAFMGTDVAEGAQLIGKALQSPTEGITALERQFGKLTDAQERNIKKLVEQNRGYEAQQAVLQIVRERVGGTAELMNDGLKEATSGVSKAWDDMLKGWSRTQTVGGTVVAVLHEVRDALKAATPEVADPLGPFKESLRGLDAEIKRIENSRPKKGRSPLVDERLAELKAERDGIEKTIRAAESKGVDPFAFDPSRLNVQLGGKTDDAGRKKRDEDERKRREAMAKQQQDTAEAYAKALRDVNQGEEENLATAIEHTDSTERLNKLREQQNELTTAYAKALRDTTQGEAENVATAVNLGDKTEKISDAARELGFTFQSAFEDAILAGEKFDDLLVAIEKDIARIIIRQAITEPAGNAIAKAVSGFNFGSLFGSGGGEAAAVAAGIAPAYATGTDFVPRDGLAYLHRGEAVIPAAENRGGGSGVSVVQNIHVDSRADIASVHAAMAVARDQAVVAMRRELRNGGPASRYAAGG